MNDELRKKYILDNWVKLSEKQALCAKATPWKVSQEFLDDPKFNTDKYKLGDQFLSLLFTDEKAIDYKVSLPLIDNPWFTFWTKWKIVLFFVPDVPFDNIEKSIENKNNEVKKDNNFKPF